MVSVSIIVPVHNAEEFLEQCITSLVMQTLRDIEVIAVNDASTDDSLSILKKLELQFPDKLVIIDLKDNVKPGGARNLGLEAARGEYIAFMDNDDWADVTMLERLYLKALDTGADIVACDYYNYYGDDVSLEYVVNNTKEQIGVLTDEMRKSLILSGGRIWAKIWKKELWMDNNIRFPVNLTFDDNAVSPVFCYASKLEKIPEPLMYYRSNNQSISRTKNSLHVFDRLDVAKILVENFKEKGLYEKYKPEVDMKFVGQYYIATIPICLLGFDKPQKEYLLQMRAYIRAHYKDYRKNPYFKLRYSRLQRFLPLCNDISPAFLCISVVVLRSVKHTVTLRKLRNR